MVRRLGETLKYLQVFAFPGKEIALRAIVTPPKRLQVAQYGQAAFCLGANVIDLPTKSVFGSVPGELHECAVSVEPKLTAVEIGVDNPFFPYRENEWLKWTKKRKVVVHERHHFRLK